MRASILINNYNYEGYLREAIESALAQSYLDKEVIVVDDGSTDGSVQVAESFGARIELVRSENRGQNSALNLAVQAARGDLLFFLDSDDVLHPNRVERMASRFVAEGLVGTPAHLYNTTQRVDARGRPIFRGARDVVALVRRPIGRYLRPTYLTRPEPLLAQFRETGSETEISNFPPSAFAMTRALAERIFPLPVGVTKAYSDIYVNRAAKLMAPCVKVPECLTDYRVHDSSFTASPRLYEVDGRTLNWPSEVEADIRFYLAGIAEASVG